MSFVEGQENFDYLKKRFEALQKCHLFEGMEFSNNFEKIKNWIPLMMEERNPLEPIVVTHTTHGTDLNFGALTQSLCKHLKDKFEVDVLREFIPTAKHEDWELAIAGQRVQVIRKDEEEGGVLEFGTEVVTAKDGTIAALLGVSPGASTIVVVVVEVIEECFPELMQSEACKEKLAKMIPSYGKSLKDDEVLTKQLREFTFEALGA